MTEQEILSQLRELRAESKILEEAHDDHQARAKELKKQIDAKREKIDELIDESERLANDPQARIPFGQEAARESQAARELECAPGQAHVWETIRNDEVIVQVCENPECRVLRSGAPKDGGEPDWSYIFPMPGVSEEEIREAPAEGELVPTEPA